MPKLDENKVDVFAIIIVRLLRMFALRPLIRWRKLFLITLLQPTSLSRWNTYYSMHVSSILPQTLLKKKKIVRIGGEKKQPSAGSPKRDKKEQIQLLRSI